MYIAMLIFLIFCSCFRGPPIELASNRSQSVTLEYKCMRRNENEDRNMKIVETLFRKSKLILILKIFAPHTAPTPASRSSTGSVPLCEPRSDPDTLPSMEAVSGVSGVTSSTPSHYHNAVSHTVILVMIVYLVRVLVLQTRAGAVIISIIGHLWRGIGYCRVCSHAGLTLTLSQCSAHFWRGVIDRIRDVLNYDSHGVITRSPGLNEERAPSRLSHAIIGLHLNLVLGQLPSLKSISELIMIYMSIYTFISCPPLFLEWTTSNLCSIIIH